MTRSRLRHANLYSGGVAGVDGDGGRKKLWNVCRYIGHLGQTAPSTSLHTTTEHAAMYATLNTDRTCQCAFDYQISAWLSTVYWQSFVTYRVFIYCVHIYRSARLHWLLFQGHHQLILYVHTQRNTTTRILPVHTTLLQSVHPRHYYCQYTLIPATNVGANVAFLRSWRLLQTTCFTYLHTTVSHDNYTSRTTYNYRDFVYNDNYDDEYSEPAQTTPESSDRGGGHWGKRASFVVKGLKCRCKWRVTPERVR